MPFYVYENIDTGERVEEFRLIKDRDVCPEGCRRVFVNPVALVGDFLVPKESDEERTMKYLSKMEDKMGTKGVERESGYSANELLRVWSPENAPAFEPIEPATGEVAA